MKRTTAKQMAKNSHKSQKEKWGDKYSEEMKRRALVGVEKRKNNTQNEKAKGVNKSA